MRPIRSLYLPLVTLALLLVLSLYTARAACSYAQAWTGGLSLVREYAMEENWPQAEDRLLSVYADWDRLQPLCHILFDQERLDGIESLFSSVMAACLQKTEEEEFYPLLSQLDTELRLLAETQAVSLSNIL